MAQLPLVVAEAMLRGINEPGVRIIADAYESESGVSPVAAAVRYAEAHGDKEKEWDPAWGKRKQFRQRVVVFVLSFDRSAEIFGLDQTVKELRSLLRRRIEGADRS